MEEVLMGKFQEYVVLHNPELVLKSRDAFPASRMIRERVASVLPTLKFLQDQGRSEADIVSICMEQLTRDLKPSRADYLREVLKTEFPHEFDILSEHGKLTWHLAELVTVCAEQFEAFGFSEQNKDSHLLRHAIIASVATYLEL